MAKIIKHIILEFLKEKNGFYTSREIAEACLIKYPDLKPSSVSSVVTSLNRVNFIDRSIYPPYSYKINNRGIELLEELDNTYLEICDFGCYKKAEVEKYENLTESEILEIILSYLSSEDRWMTAREISEYLDLPSHYPSRIASKLRLLYQEKFVNRKKDGSVFLYSINKGKKTNEIKNPNKKQIIYLNKEIKLLLDKSIKELLDFGIDVRMIDKICYESLEALIGEQLITRRKFEIDYLKRENSLFLKDFELMKNEITSLEKELIKHDRSR